MFSGYRSSHPIAAGMLPWPAGRVTFIAKLILSLDANGVFVPTSGPIPPLQLDVSDDAAELLYPSDFAPYKAACDVLVVGAAVRHRGVGTLTVGEARARLDAHESLGPRQGFCPRGDPLDPSVVSLWSTGGGLPSRFQSAPPARRFVWPTSALRLAYERSGVHISGDLVGPFPRAFVVGHEPSRVLARVPLVLDTICLAPEHARITVLYRGVYERTYAADISELLVLDFERTAAFDLGDARHWQTHALATTAQAALARPVPHTRNRAAESAQVTVSVNARAARAPALPFAPTDPSVPGSPALNRAELESLRQQSRIEHDWDAPGTSLASRSPPGPGDERVRMIMREIWRGERSVADILLSHGLTDAEWRVLRDKSAGRAP